jgi:hypothetical protein
MARCRKAKPPKAKPPKAKPPKGPPIPDGYCKSCSFRAHEGDCTIPPCLECGHAYNEPPKECVCRCHDGWRFANRLLGVAS